MSKKTKGFVLWFTGLPSSGKTTISQGVCRVLRNKGLIVKHLDGDVIRRKINKDLSFSKRDRGKNLAIAADLAKSLIKQENIVIASFVSPYQDQRKRIRKKLGNFIEIFVNTPLEICQKRDIKGLYKKAHLGQIKNFTGVSGPYEPPERPEIELKTAQESVKQSVDKVIKYLLNNNYL